MLRNPFVPKFDLKKVMEQAPKESKVKEMAPKAVSSLAIANKSNSGDFQSKLALVGYMFITNPTITADELAAVVEAEYPRAFATPALIDVIHHKLTNGIYFRVTVHATCALSGAFVPANVAYTLECS